MERITVIEEKRIYLMNRFKKILYLFYVVTLIIILSQSTSNADDLEKNKIISDLDNSIAKIDYLIGIQNFYGRGIPQNYKKAAEAFLSAANKGHIEAQSNLGVLYAKGLGVLQDDNEAVKWYTLAAEQGNSTAQNNLGWMFENGKGVSINYTKAHMWYNIAARYNNEIARKNRDRISEKMSTEKTNQAQYDAEQCIKQNYKNCDF